MLTRVRQVVLEASADLGPDLGGFSPVDLLVDNWDVICPDDTITSDVVNAARNVLRIANLDYALSERAVARYR